MSKRSAKHPGPGWFSLSDCALIFDVSRQQFERKYRPLAGADDVRTVGGAVFIRARGLLDNFIASELERRLAITNPDDAAMLAAGDSPALERWRNARAAMAELDLKEREGELVRLSFVLAHLATLTKYMASRAHEAAKRWGADAADLWNEAIDEWRAGADRAEALLTKDAAPAADRDRNG